MNVLIIENSEILNERYTRLLSTLDGIEMLTHSSLSDKTIEFVKSQKPEVVVLAQDVDSNEFIRNIKLLKKQNPKTYIIILSAKPFPQINKKYKESGADFILDKSTEFNKLPEVFQELNVEKAN